MADSPVRLVPKGRNGKTIPGNTSRERSHTCAPLESGSRNPQFKSDHALRAFKRNGVQEKSMKQDYFDGELARALGARSHGIGL
jgi:hypothetical protein